MGAPDPALIRLIEEDLYNELRWMLVAASEWQADRDADKAWAGRPGHLDVAAMDSALLHARALYEFFLAEPRPRKGLYRDQAYAQREFGVTLRGSALHSTWIDALNKRLFHIDLKRPAPEDRHGSPLASIDVNEQVVAIAQDVLNLWDEFTKSCPDYALYLNTRRELAIEDAERSAASCGRTSPVFV